MTGGEGGREGREGKVMEEERARAKAKGSSPHVLQRQSCCKELTSARKLCSARTGERLSAMQSSARGNKMMSRGATGLWERVRDSGGRGARSMCVPRHVWQAKGSARARLAIRGWGTGAAGAGTHEEPGHGAVEETVAV